MKSRSILIYIAIIILIIAGCFFAAYQYFFGNLTKDESFSEAAKNQVERLAIPEVPELDEAKIVNIAIFGIDSESGEKGRSDATMILSVDYEHNKIKICSIARDSLVYIPDKDINDKLTHAYAYGGAELAVKTLNANYNTHISDYVSVNFSGLADIIDLVGGVHVDLTEAERKRLPDNDTLSAGEDVLLNGKQAVAYSRIRKIDSDNVRTSRQREVLASLFQKARSMSATQYPSLIRQCMSLCTTSLDYTEILSFSQILLQTNLSLKQNAIPGDNVEYWGGIMPNGTWCAVYDMREASDVLLTFIYEEIYTNSDYVLPEATVDMSVLD